MTPHQDAHDPLPPLAEGAVRALYAQVIAGWNRHDADGFAAPFAADAEVIGFDGSVMSGQAAIRAELRQLFAVHETAPYIVKVRSVRLVSAQAAVLRAIVGMIPLGQEQLNPALNAHQIVVAEHAGHWQVVLLQTTPAQFHGRPKLVSAMTDELRIAAAGGGA